MTGTEAAVAALQFVDPALPRAVPAGRPTTLPGPGTGSRPGRGRELEVEVAGAGHVRDLDGWLDETHATSLVVVDRGEVVHEWYAAGLGPDTRFLGASMTKSLLAHLVGRAVTSGVLDPADPVAGHVPELADSAYGACSVLDLLTMTTGADWVEDHRDPAGPASRLVRCFLDGAGDSRALLRAVRPRHVPGTQWEYSTADSQVLDWVRERATGEPFDTALADLWSALGCEQDAAVAVDAGGVALAGGGVAATTRDWARVGLLALDGTVAGQRLHTPGWVEAAGVPPLSFLAPGRLPSSITTHAGFARHWWPLDPTGRRFTADGSRGQFCYVDRDTGAVVARTSLWPFGDVMVDRQCRDLCYLGLPAIAEAAVRTRDTPRRETL